MIARDEIREDRFVAALYRSDEFGVGVSGVGHQEECNACESSWTRAVSRCTSVTLSDGKVTMQRTDGVGIVGLAILRYGMVALLLMWGAAKFTAADPQPATA
jgi:hypothetical protein